MIYERSLEDCATVAVKFSSGFLKRFACVLLLLIIYFKATAWKYLHRKRMKRAPDSTHDRSSRSIRTKGDTQRSCDNNEAKK